MPKSHIAIAGRFVAGRGVQPVAYHLNDVINGSSMTVAKYLPSRQNTIWEFASRGQAARWTDRNRRREFR